MNLLDRTKKSIDEAQKHTKPLAFLVAVIKRYGNDRTGRQAALITYYGFLSLFPLLLLFITILNIVIAGNPTLQDSISHQVFQYFPALGTQLQNSVHGAKSGGIALILELLILLYGARGFTIILREAFDHVWRVKMGEGSRNFVSDSLRSLAMVSAVGVGIIVSTAVSYALTKTVHIGVLGTILVTVVNAAFTSALFLIVFRLGTSKQIKTKGLVLGAIITGVLVLGVRYFGAYIMANQLSRLNSTSGSFALALAVLFWIYLQAQIIMYALTITAVQVERDYPKSLFD